MFCNACAAALPEGSSFCNRCGAPQGGAPAGAKPKAAEAPGKEEEVWRGRYSARAMGLAFVGAGLWFVASWIAYFALSREGSWFENQGWLVWLISGLSVIPALYAAWVALVRKLTMRYRVTSQRIFVERGFISRDIEEVELIRVDDVAVRQSAVQRLFDVGVVTVVSTDSRTPRLEIDGIRSPVEIKEKLRMLVQARRKGIVNFESL